MQWLHFAICALGAFILIFYSRLPVIVLLSILSGYYFIFEYTVLSRNYALGILFSFLICLILSKEFRYRSAVYYMLLFLLSNTHLLGLIMAFCFHSYFLRTSFLKKKIKKKYLLHLLTGIIVVLPSAIFIFPSADSSLSPGFWLSIWNKDQGLVVLQTPLKAMLPLPTWQEYYFWNTNYVIELLSTQEFLWIKTALISLILTGLAAFVLWKDKKGLLFFILNVILTLSVALVFPLVTARYVGFIYVGFVMALWLSGMGNDLRLGKKSILGLLLLFQLPGGIIALKKDWALPFSQSHEIENVLNKVAGHHVITDYWALNYVSAMTDKPFYCVGFNREKSFLLWDREMALILKKPYIYAEGIIDFLKTKKSREVYLLSNNSLDQINKRDSSVFKTFNIELIIEKKGAIEKYSDLYLYHVASRPPINN